MKRIIVLIIILICSPSWAAYDNNILMQGKKSNISIHETNSMLQECSKKMLQMNCLSSDAHIIEAYEREILNFFIILQQYCIQKNNKEFSLYQLWEMGKLQEYFKCDVKEVKSDWKVYRISPGLDKTIKFTPFFCNININSDISTVIASEGAHAGYLLAHDMLKSYCKEILPHPAFEKQISKIKKSKTQSQQVRELSAFFCDVSRYIQNYVKNPDYILEEALIEYYVTIKQKNKRSFLFFPKRPKSLNFREFEVQANDETIHVLHSYNFYIPNTEK